MSDSQKTLELLEDLKRYQRSDYVHPLTCIESSHLVLIPFIEEDEVKLLCPTCGEISRPPKLKFREILSHVRQSFESFIS